MSESDGEVNSNTSEQTNGQEQTGTPLQIPKLKISRVRNESASSSESNGLNGNSLTPDGKRQKPGSPNTGGRSPPASPAPSSPLAMTMFPNGVPASPPRFVSLEEIMKAANEVENMILAHEIAVDKNFRLEKAEPTRNSIEGKIKEIMHRAFWDVLESQLNESPPNFKQAMVLLGEIKENILSLLLPQHTKLRTEIEEILDLDLILQQAENGILDFPRYAQYILSVCARLCAPVRDEKIRELTQTNEVVPLFRGIMELLEVMRLDMANFHIQQMRPHIQQKSVQYERQKFQEFLETQSKLSGVDGLEQTRLWLQRNFEALDLSIETNIQNIINKVMISSYLELLLWNNSKLESYPETLLMDASRFNALTAQVQKLIITGSVLLITNATVGSSIHDLQDFRETLKNHLLVILADNEKHKEMKEDDCLKSQLEALSVQVIHDVKKCLETHGFPPLDASKKSALETQIADLSNPNNRIRKVVERRVIEFMEGVLSSPTAAPMQIPTGLSVLQNELSGSAGQLIRLVAHNRAVFSQFYADIISKILPDSTSLSLTRKADTSESESIEVEAN